MKKKRLSATERKIDDLSIALQADMINLRTVIDNLREDNERLRDRLTMKPPSAEELDGFRARLNTVDRRIDHLTILLGKLVGDAFLQGKVLVIQYETDASKLPAPTASITKALSDRTVGDAGQPR